VNFEATPQPIDILLVDDNDADVRLTQEVFADTKLQNRLVIAQNGEEAIDCLRQQGKYRGSPRPDLILLDLNLPVKSGREVLAEIKSDPNLKSIPVVILTTSRAEEDIVKTYDLHANCYITKPVDLERFVTVVSHIQDFWLAIVKLPRSATPCLSIASPIAFPIASRSFSSKTIPATLACSRSPCSNPAMTASTWR
jgi:two-component system, chemotaxis family, response regulator Rcp1